MDHKNRKVARQRLASGLPIKSIIENIVPPEHRWKFVLFKNWDSIIGALKPRVSIEKVDNSILFVRVKHPVWAQEIMLLAPLLCNKINALFSEQKISSIRVHCNNHQTQVQSREQPQRHGQGVLYQHSTETQLSIEELHCVADVRSNELQSIITAYLTRCKRIQRRSDEKTDCNAPAHTLDHTLNRPKNTAK